MADPSKTEPATPRRKQEARKRGQVARSPELTGALLLLTVLLFFRFAGGNLLEAIGDEARWMWGNLGPREMATGQVAAAGASLLGSILLALAPFFILVIAVAIGSNVAQFGILFTTQTLAFKPEHLNPADGFKRVFSQRTFVELFRGLVKVFLVAWVFYWALKTSHQEIVLEGVRPLGAAFASAGNVAWRLGIRVVLVLLAIAILDYLYQRYNWERNLRMTRQEVKDEFKQTEGDPLVKARIRQMQREVARRRMISEVPQADVVITNPVHLAVALRYDPGSSRAPSIVAKGARLLAARIRELATKHRVPIYEDPPLAQSLYALKVGSEVSPELFHAVAQILAFVYHAGKRNKERKVLADMLNPGPSLPDAAGSAETDGLTEVAHYGG